ncbi:MAG: hypothetical protein KUG72_09495 [Pseudomonadales bacterium]|nr:hypothetical protein [Pseudomonadales bacterium]
MLTRTIIPILVTVVVSTGFSQLAYSDQQWESFNQKLTSKFQDHPFTLNLPSPILIADNSVSTDPVSDDVMSNDTKNSSEETTIEFKESYWTPNKMHQYVGLTALSLVAIAMVAPKEEDGLHESAAKGAALLGAAAVAGGLYIHWDDVDFSEGFSDPNNLHALFASLGAIAMLYAAAEGPDDGHAGIGALGAISMAVAVKITW